MKPIAEINDFYKKNLRSKLRQIEKERDTLVKRMMQKFYIVVGVLFLLLLISEGFNPLLIAVLGSFSWAAHFIYTVETLRLNEKLWYKSPGKPEAFPGAEAETAAL
ncbi:MAG: hypothetical protein MUP09_06230 [Thiovulaceae bacterium]|nr:hypothetical protein [Sulfurimonadaceae bacterium]